MSSAWLIGSEIPALEDVAGGLAECGLAVLCMSALEASQRLRAPLGPTPALTVVSADRRNLAGARAFFRACWAADCDSFATLALSDGIDLIDDHGAWTLADDFLRLPFEPAELAARLTRMLHGRRQAVTEQAAHGLAIDVLSRRAYSDGSELQLTRREFDLLHFLSRHPGRAFSRDALLRQVWPDGDYGEARTVDVHVRRVRSKLGAHRHLITTLHGVGYRFESLPTQRHLRAVG